MVLNFTLGMPLGLQPLQILSVDLGSEMPPAVSLGDENHNLHRYCRISLAYEPPESDIMKVPPRSAKTSLVSKQLIVYSYIFTGFFITIACCLAYLSVYQYHGIGFTDLLFTSEYYFIPGALNFTKSDGSILNKEDQLHIRNQVQTERQAT